jgi:Cu/Ag efflux protein CusF
MQFNVTNKREGGENIMKKGLMIVLAILISVAFVTTVLAQDKKAPAPAAATDKPAAATDKPVKEKAVDKAKKAGVKKFAGEFVSMDEAAKTIVVKGESEMTFDVSKVKKMAKFAAGDKVNVVYTEADGKNVAKAVAKAGAVKEKAKEKKEKKEEKPAAEKPATEKPAAAPVKK